MYCNACNVSEYKQKQAAAAAEVKKKIKMHAHNAPHARNNSKVCHHDATTQNTSRIGGTVRTQHAVILLMSMYMYVYVHTTAVLKMICTWWRTKRARMCVVCICLNSARTNVHIRTARVARSST